MNSTKQQEYQLRKLKKIRTFCKAFFAKGVKRTITLLIVILFWIIMGLRGGMGFRAATRGCNPLLPH
jgi:hypothetical protein